jgi:predicted N-acetyltransferase YhbS
MDAPTRTVIPLANVDAAMIEELLDRAFGEDRHGRTAYRIREGMAWLPALSFAALDADDMLIGTIQAWPVALTDRQGRAHPMVMVGPVAVLPGHQNEGYGRALMGALAGAHGPGHCQPPVHALVKPKRR